MLQKGVNERILLVIKSQILQYFSVYVKIIFTESFNINQ